MSWNLVLFVGSVALLVVDLVLFWRVMRGRSSAARAEKSAERIEAACAAHARVVQGALVELAERGDGPRTRRPIEIAEGWGEPDQRDAPESRETPTERQEFPEMAAWGEGG